MTEHHAGYIVVLEKDIREDDAQAVIAAIRQIRGVVDVQPVRGDNTLVMAQIREHFKISEKLRELIKDWER